MITYRKGDVLEALREKEIDAIAHGCNCSGGFGSGIAKQIANQYPQVRNEYIFQHHAKNGVLGKIHPIAIENGTIINCYTQDEYGREEGRRYCSYNAIREVMIKLARYAEWKEPLRIGMPLIGAGLAGGDWLLIENIIDIAFRDSNVYIYKL